VLIESAQPHGAGQRRDGDSWGYVTTGKSEGNEYAMLLGESVRYRPSTMACFDNYGNQGEGFGVAAVEQGV
jgi:hypothetical protein